VARTVSADRPVYVITFRPEPNTDHVRAVRALLKLALRMFRLRLHRNHHQGGRAVSERDNRLVKLAEMWERISTKGTKYYWGYLGSCSLVMFDAGEQDHPTRPGERVHVWKLFVQERDPERRPQKRDLPTRGQQAHETVRERADAAAEVIFSENSRDEYTRELAERFDQRRPDEVPW
jgi:hypothetical protein